MTYLPRILSTYLRPRGSNLSFWHEMPEMSDAAFTPGSPAYYMTFAGKAAYAGPFDDRGVPMLDYRGAIGRHYNPIAVAQYGLACLNRELPIAERALPIADCRLSIEGEGDRRREWMRRAVACADWLVANERKNAQGLSVWMHDFDWRYFRRLKAPWYSGLAQGQGVSLLLRVARSMEHGAESIGQRAGDEARGGGCAQVYRAVAERALRTMRTPVAEGGVLWTDGDGCWIEEYITEPLTHILNGCIWAVWGLRDADLLAGDRDAGELFARCAESVARRLPRFESHGWSLYDLAPLGMENPASPFYHALHCVQLRVMHRLTSDERFRTTAERWEGYGQGVWCRACAVGRKIVFKLRHY